MTVHPGAYRKWAKTIRAGVDAALDGREEPPQQEPFTEAWIAYALFLSRPSPGKTSVKLEEILATADALNYAVPSQNEVAWALARLKKRGWLALDARNFRVTEPGSKQIEQLTAGEAGISGPLARLQEWLVAHPP